MLRDAEAECVADTCSRLIGNVTVRDEHADGGKRPCRPGDIALLAPTGTDLWRFEQALEDRGISVSTQAGKGFFRRQEVADLIALTRTLADSTRHARARGAAARPAGRAHRGGAPRHRRSIAAGPRPAGSPAVPRSAHRQRRGQARARALRAGSAAIAAPKGALHDALRAPRRCGSPRSTYARSCGSASGAAPNGRSPMWISFSKWRAPTTCAGCAHSRATCGRIGPMRCARWREGRMPRRMRSH